MVLLFVHVLEKSTRFFNSKGSFKVSEYPFKQNRSMLKIMIVLLYTYFLKYIFKIFIHIFLISLNVLRRTFSNIYNLTFYALQILVKLGLKLGQKLTTFPTLWAPAPTELRFLMFCFHWYVANQETNNTVPTIFFLLNMFCIISF